MESFADYGISMPPWGRIEYRTRCPQCGKSDRDNTLGVSVEKECWHCFRCGWKGSLRNGVNRNIIAIEPQRQKRSAEANRASINRVLNGSVSINSPEAEPVRDYLANRLGHTLLPLPRIGFHPRLPYFDSLTGERRGKYPAMIGRIVNIVGCTVSLHRTYIKDGKKAPVHSPKKLMSPPPPETVTGCTVRLYDATDTVVLAEGIETAIALSQALEIPAWACLSANGLKSVCLPESISSVIIGADNDKSGTGQDAGHTLRRRLLKEGRKATLMIPKQPGDWLDEYVLNSESVGNPANKSPSEKRDTSEVKT